MTSISNHSPRQRNKGVVLVVCLLLLLVLTLIGLTAARTATMQQRMSGNQYAHELAFQAAEAALRDGERYLQSPSIGPFDGTHGLYDTDPLKTTAHLPSPLPDDFWDNDTRVFSGDLNHYAAAMLPRYYIVHTTRVEEATKSPLGSDTALPPSTIYRIVARGTGPNGKTVIVLQSFFKR